MLCQHIVPLMNKNIAQGYYDADKTLIERFPIIPTKQHDIYVNGLMLSYSRISITLDPLSICWILQWSMLSSRLSHRIPLLRPVLTSSARPAMSVLHKKNSGSRFLVWDLPSAALDSSRRSCAPSITKGSTSTVTSRYTWPDTRRSTNKCRAWRWLCWYWLQDMCALLPWGSQGTLPKDCSPDLQVSGLI